MTDEKKIYVSEPDKKFYMTEPGQILAGAQKYISAARLLRHSETWKERPTLLQTPTLHLLAQGVELLLKYPLLAGGMSAEKVKDRFGHNLMKLWRHEANSTLRQLVLAEAVVAWVQARNSGMWPDDDFDKLPADEVLTALETLAYLHSAKSGFALRYTVEPDTRSPRPAFLIDVFGYVTDRSIGNWNYPLVE